MSTENGNVLAKEVATKNKKTKTETYIRTYENPDQKTPYQGSRRTFGYFHCLTCKVDWSSANTWANKGQDCFTCLENTYPYRQKRLLRGNRIRNNDKPHPEAHCEMCKDLKHVCKNKWIIDQKKMKDSVAGENPESADKSGSGEGKKIKKNRRPRRRNRNKKPAPAAAANEE